MSSNVDELFEKWKTLIKNEKREPNMSTDDFFQDPNVLFEKWLKQPWGDLSCLSESIDSNSLFYVKKAFLEGYQSGFDAKKNLNWLENNQK